MKTRSVVFESPGRAALLEEDLDGVDSGEVLIETEVTLISTGTEMTIYSGEFPPGGKWSQYADFPHRPGYSNIAKVREVGDGVEGLEPGDRVFSWVNHTSHAIVSPEKLIPVPEGMEPSAAAFGTLAQIALNGVRLGGLTLGECTVIAGVGPVGMLALQIAGISGAFPLVAMDLSNHRLGIANVHGADYAINPAGQSPAQELSRISKGRMADVVYDVTGSPSFTPEGLKLIKKGGRMVILGSPRGAATVDFHEEVHSLGLRIIGAHNAMHAPVESHWSQWTLSRDAELFFDLVAAGRIRVDGLVSHRFGWHEAPEAYRLLAKRRGETMCILIDWSG